MEGANDRCRCGLSTFYNCEGEGCDQSVCVLECYCEMHVCDECQCVVCSVCFASTNCECRDFVGGQRTPERVGERPCYRSIIKRSYTRSFIRSGNMELVNECLKILKF